MDRLGSFRHMRIFCIISSWVCWLICVAYVVKCCFIRSVDAIPLASSTPRCAKTIVAMFWCSFGVFSFLGAVSHFVLRHFWFRRQRNPGIGFWRLSVLFYFSVLFVTEAGFVSYYLMGDGSTLQWISVIVGAGFCVLGFPCLPGRRESSGFAETSGR